MAFKTIKSRTMYEGRRIVVLRDRVKYPDGAERDYDVVQHPGAVTMVPVDRDGNIWMIKQYRYAIKTTLLELPAGTIEEGEDPEVCAIRELREEIGVTADSIKKAGEFFLAPGYSTEYMYVYLASDLREAPLDPDEGEFIKIVKIPAEEAYMMLAEDKIRDAKTLAGLSLAAPHMAGLVGK